jgi:hypothetical protein
MEFDPAIENAYNLSMKPFVFLVGVNYQSLSVLPLIMPLLQKFKRERKCKIRT